jgi:hypothetical protein
MPPGFTLHRDYRTSQLSETASNFSHCCEMPDNCELTTVGSREFAAAETVASLFLLGKGFAPKRATKPKVDADSALRRGWHDDTGPRLSPGAGLWSTTWDRKDSVSALWLHVRRLAPPYEILATKIPARSRPSP